MLGRTVEILSGIVTFRSQYYRYLWQVERQQKLKLLTTVERQQKVNILQQVTYNVSTLLQPEFEPPQAPQKNMKYVQRKCNGRFQRGEIRVVAFLAMEHLQEVIYSEVEGNETQASKLKQWSLSLRNTYLLQYTRPQYSHRPT